jgi:phosphomevalonate kinase
LNTGLNDNFVRQNGFRFYPNPAKGNITIEMKNYEGKSEIQIIDIHGKICLKNHVSTEKTTLKISHLPAGVYLLKVLNENKTETVKFIKD